MVTNFVLVHGILEYIYSSLQFGSVISYPTKKGKQIIEIIETKEEEGRRMICNRFTFIFSSRGCKHEERFFFPWGKVLFTTWQ